MPFTADKTPYSRPGTSRDAAESQAHKKAHDVARIRDMLIQRGDRGMTCWEIEEAGPYPHQTASARLYDMHTLSDPPRVCESGQRRKTGNGRQAIVWIAAEYADAEQLLATREASLKRRKRKQPAGPAVSELEYVRALLLDCLLQGCEVSNTGLIDTCALSTYAECADYLAKKGMLEILKDMGGRGRMARLPKQAVSRSG